MISRRKFIGGMLGAGIGGPVLLRLWAGETLFPEGCRLTSIAIPAPAGWAGKRALFVSDVHFGYYFGAKAATSLNNIVRRHNPDLVLMGGDLAQTPKTNLSEFFSHWSPGCPTIYAPGNHDMDDRMISLVMKQCQDAGLHVLSNSRDAWNGITFIGVPSALRRQQQLSLLDAPGLKIVIGHEPDMWDNYRQPDLVHLAGHTHGGQVRILGSPLYLPTLGRKYSRGEFRAEGNRSLIVSTGIGCTDVPVRINCPPEIIEIVFA
jgi:predicted MPP superfamily phosphohydrolase